MADTLLRVPLSPGSEAFFRLLVTGVIHEQLDLDSVVAPCLAKGWGLDRIALTDLVALRLATYELVHLPGMPPKVSIAEAVELAGRYGSRSSTGFVNGVLATILRQSPKAKWDPTHEDKPTEDEEAYIPEETVELVEVTEGSPEAEELKTDSPWVLRTQG